MSKPGFFARLLGKTEATPSSKRAAANAALHASGYPDLLPGSACTPAQADPFWFDTCEPGEVWDRHLSKVTQHTVVQPVQVTSSAQETTTPPSVKPPNSLRFMVVSDTHNHHARLPVPHASLGVDVLLHAGDFSNVGEAKDCADFAQWVHDFPARYKVVIAGNHDVSFDEAEYSKTLARRFRHKVVLDPTKLKRDLDPQWAAGQQGDEAFPAFPVEGGTRYLEDQGVSIEGIRIWGSPWQPEFYSWGFNLPRGAPLREKWDLIPNETDILITHGPPVGHGDLCLPGKNRAGCIDLLAQIQTRIKPRYHISGHIHEGYGQTTDGVTDYVNGSNCNMHYDPAKLNPPIIFDMQIPAAAASASESASAAASSSTTAETKPAAATAAADK